MCKRIIGYAVYLAAVVVAALLAIYGMSGDDGLFAVVIGPLALLTLPLSIPVGLLPVDYLVMIALMLTAAVSNAVIVDRLLRRHLADR